MTPAAENTIDDSFGPAAAIGVALASVAVCLAVAFALGQGTTTVAGLPVPVWCAILAILIQWVAFVPAFAARTEHYYDLTGSATYLSVLILAALCGGAWAADASPRVIRAATAAGLSTVWALRLGLFLFRRVQRAGGDGRFDTVKQSGPRFFVAWSVQGLWVFLTLAAVVVVLTAQSAPPLGIPFYAGVAIWLFGFTIEVVADAQKSAFKKDPANEGRFIACGLWSWSRHPNYFGEIVLWIGMAVLALPLLEGWRWVALVSPVFVTLLLVKGSGIPPLETRADERWGGQPDYERYKERTSVLIPLPPGA